MFWFFLCSLDMWMLSVSRIRRETSNRLAGGVTRLSIRVIQSWSYGYTTTTLIQSWLFLCHNLSYVNKLSYLMTTFIDYNTKVLVTHIMFVKFVPVILHSLNKLILWSYFLGTFLYIILVYFLRWYYLLYRISLHVKFE